MTLPPGFEVVAGAERLHPIKADGVELMRLFRAKFALLPILPLLVHPLAQRRTAGHIAVAVRFAKRQQPGMILRPARVTRTPVEPDFIQPPDALRRQQPALVFAALPRHPASQPAQRFPFARDAGVAVLFRESHKPLVHFFPLRSRDVKDDAEGDQSPDSAGLSPAQQLAVVKEMAALQLKRLHEISERDILPSLDGIGIRILDFSDLDTSLRAGVVRFFKDEVLPVITPLGIDAARPFPMLPSLSINLAVLFEPEKDKKEGEPRLGVVPVPAALPRLVRVPGADSIYVRLETVVLSQLSTLFPGQVVRDVAAFRVLRDAELDIDDEGGGDRVTISAAAAQEAGIEASTGSLGQGLSVGIGCAHSIR